MVGPIQGGILAVRISLSTYFRCLNMFWISEYELKTFEGLLEWLVSGCSTTSSICPSVAWILLTNRPFCGFLYLTESYLLCFKEDYVVECWERCQMQRITRFFPSTMSCFLWLCQVHQEPMSSLCQPMSTFINFCQPGQPLKFTKHCTQADLRLSQAESWLNLKSAWVQCFVNFKGWPGWLKVDMGWHGLT
jgi:hypothetical protein